VTADSKEKGGKTAKKVKSKVDTEATGEDAWAAAAQGRKVTPL
jgi:hypothetical protein